MACDRDGGITRQGKYRPLGPRLWLHLDRRRHGDRASKASEFLIDGGGSGEADFPNSNAMACSQADEDEAMHSLGNDDDAVVGNEMMDCASSIGFFQRMRGIYLSWQR